MQSLAPAQTLSGGWVTFTPSLNPGQVTLMYCSAQDGNRCGQVNIAVGAPTSGLTLRPQNFSGQSFRRLPGAQLHFGIEVNGLTASGVTCALNPAWAGTIVDVTNAPDAVPVYPRSYRVTYGPNNGGGDVQFRVECGHPDLPPGWKESFPLTTAPSNEAIPTLTMSTIGNGSTTIFKQIQLSMGQNGSPLDLVRFEVVVSPVGQTFSYANACAIRGEIFTGSPNILQIWPALKTDSGVGDVAGPGSTFFPFPVSTTGEWSNSQCTLSQAQSQGTMSWQPYYQTTMQASPAIRYAPSFTGTHTLRGIVYNSAYVSSGWLPLTGGTLLVQ